MWYKDVFNYDNHLIGKGFTVTFDQHIKSQMNIFGGCSCRLTFSPVDSSDKF